MRDINLKVTTVHSHDIFLQKKGGAVSFETVSRKKPNQSALQ